LKNREIKEEFSAKGLKKAKVELDILKLSDEEWREYQANAEALRYEASMVESSYGVGKLDGIEEGKKEAILGEKNQKALEMAKEMKEAGEPVDKIIKYTKLTKEEIGNI
jgi:predicted transposase/invertase (TIGR01784 family)